MDEQWAGYNWLTNGAGLQLADERRKGYSWRTSSAEAAAGGRAVTVSLQREGHHRVV